VNQKRLAVDGEEQARAPVPDTRSLRELREAAEECRACGLWRNGTQTVFGAGPVDADVMFVGEQPGDQEDLAGQPFVGPAGRVLDEALAEAGIDRSRAYVTNAVKHFKWQPRGKRRIHQKPNAAELAACRLWLDAELAVVRPRVLVVLGATAGNRSTRRSPRSSSPPAPLLDPAGARRGGAATGHARLRGRPPRRRPRSRGHLAAEAALDRVAQVPQRLAQWGERRRQQHRSERRGVGGGDLERRRVTALARLAERMGELEAERPAVNAEAPTEPEGVRERDGNAVAGDVEDDIDRLMERRRSGQDVHRFRLASGRDPRSPERERRCARV